MAMEWDLRLLGVMRKHILPRTSQQHELAEESKMTPKKLQPEHGFSLIELVIAMVVGIILTAMAVPTVMSVAHNLRTGGDAHDINSAIILTKMRAAADFTQSRIYFKLNSNTFEIHTCTKAVGTTGACTWPAAGTAQNEGGPSAEPLSTGDSFGFGSVSTPPSNTQTTIGEAPACLDNSGNTIANTACIVFNSRGIPIDSTGTPTGNDAIYLTDGRSVWAITISATGLIQTWRTEANSASWKNR